MERWTWPNVRSVVLALMVSTISWSLSAAGPVHGKGWPGHEDSYRETHEGKTGLTTHGQQLVRESEPRDGSTDYGSGSGSGSGSLHTQHVQSRGEAVHSEEEDQERHNDHPVETGSSGIDVDQEMKDSLAESAEAAAALEKEYINSPDKVKQPAAQEQHHRDLQNSDIQLAGSQALHLDDDKEKSDQAANQMPSARDAVSSDTNSASCTLASAQRPLQEGSESKSSEREVISSHEDSSAAAAVRVVQLDSRPTETAAHPSTSRTELQTDSQQIKQQQEQQQQQQQQQQEMAAPKPVDEQPVYQPSSFPHLFSGFKPTAKLRQLASTIGRNELEQMFESFLGGFLDYMSDVEEDDEDNSESPSVAKDSSGTKRFSSHHVIQQANQPSNTKLQPIFVEKVTNVKNTESEYENEKSSSSSGSAVYDFHEQNHDKERRGRAV